MWGRVLEPLIGHSDLPCKEAKIRLKECLPWMRCAQLICIQHAASHRKARNTECLTSVVHPEHAHE
jgi:hypothetical protein